MHYFDKTPEPGDFLLPGSFEHVGDLDYLFAVSLVSAGDDGVADYIGETEVDWDAQEGVMYGHRQVLVVGVIVDDGHRRHHEQVIGYAVNNGLQVLPWPEVTFNFDTTTNDEE